MNRVIGTIVAILLFATITSAQDKPKVELGANFTTASGNTDWAFAFADDRGYGDPAATIDWKKLSGHAIEGFVRVNTEKGFYAKGLAGEGSITKGKMTDRDFSEGQYKFADMSGKQVSGGMNYAVVDLGYTKNINAQWSIAAFGGYHYWRKDATTFGLVDNLTPANNAYYDQYNDQKTMKYETTWHVLRIGAASSITVSEHWSLDVEWAFVPKAGVVNEDSHFLRTDKNNYGPVPNVISHSSHGAGREIEASVSYRLPKNVQITGGVRYWKLRANEGTVEFGPSFADYPLRQLEMRHIGVLVGIKKTF